MRPFPRRLLRLLCGALSVAVLVGCAGTQHTVRTVKLALVTPLSGPYAPEGTRWLFAAKLALEEWNAAHADSPYPVELVTHDEEEGPAVARRLALDPAVLAVIGYSGVSLSGQTAEVFAQAELPLLSVTPLVAEGVSESRVRLLRLLPTGHELAQGVAAFLRQNLRTTAVTVVVGTRPANRSWNDAFREDFQSQGIRSLRVVPLPTDTADYQDAVQQVLASGAGAVLIAASPSETVDFLRAYGLWFGPPPLLLWDNVGPPPVTGERSGVQRVYWASGVRDPFSTEAGKAFAERYQRRWGERPSPQAAAVYDGIHLLLKAYLRAMAGGGTPTRAKVWEQLQRNEPYPGLVREYQFSSEGALLSPVLSVYAFSGGASCCTLVTELDLAR